MSDAAKPRRPEKADKSESKQVDAGFDRWLDRQVRALYDPVLKEDIPDHLMDLLDAFESREEPAAKVPAKPLAGKAKKDKKEAEDGGS